MKLQRPRTGTLRAVSHDGRVEFHRFAGHWFVRRDGRTIAENLTTVRQVQLALQEEAAK